MSLVVWLPFNNSLNDQGTGAGSFSGSPSYTTGKVTRYCLSSGTITMPAATTNKVFNKDAVSIAFWLYNGGSTGCIFGTEGMTHPNNRRFTLFQYPNATDLHWSWQNEDSDGTFTSGVASGVLASNAWSHICAVWDNGTARIYVNGNQVGTSTGTCTTTNWAYDTIIAKASSTRYYNDLRIYNHALSVKEVKELAKGLALHYKFNFEDLYVPVEYIQSSGTQWIDTLYPINTSKVKIDAKFAYTTFTDYGTIYGCQGNINLLLRQHSGGYLYMYPAGSSMATISANTIYDTSLTLTRSGSTTSYSFTINSTTSSGTTSADFSNNLYLSVFNSTNGSNGSYGSQAVSSIAARARLYYLRVCDNDKLVRNFIPCIRKSDGKPGLFDLVNNVFYTNSGTGEFTYSSTTITNTIIDCSGYGLNGTPSNITTTTTNIGTSAISFNGSSSKVDYNYLPLTSNMTYVLWMKFNSTASAHIIDNRATSGETGYQPMYGGTTYGLQCYSSNGGSYTWSSATCGFTTGVWYHLAVVITPSNATLYINGVSKGTQSGTFGSEIGARLMRLGARCSNANWFNGVMSELRVYETALSASDILELYQAKESIDKNGNLYCNSINELGNSISFKKNSVIECNSIIEGFSRTSLQGAYTQLEYIKTNGNQIINTGVADTLRTTVDLDMQVDSGMSQYWYGSTQNSGGMMYNGLYNIRALEYNWLTISRTSNNRCIMTQRLNGNNIVITMNGVTSTVSVGSTAPAGNLYIFGCNNGSRYYGAGILCRYFKIYQDNVLVRDFIPVKRNKDNAIGMLDLIHNTFYANSGTGSFTAGNEINKKYAIYTNNIIEN